jgi:two-component system chemotaxis response regulator CheY
MKILSVDDSAVVRKIIRAATEVLEFELEEAEDGLDALEKIKNLEGNVDLILLDWNMPGLNGYELLKKLKEDLKYKKIPIMMVTTEGSRENIVSAIKAGAINYMVKPFTMEELIKKIMESLGKGVM